MKPIFRPKGSYFTRVVASAPLVYFPLDEISGTVAKNWGSLGSAANGSYTGVDLRLTAGPKGNFHPYFDGANDKVDIFSAALAAAFNGSEGSFSIWCRVANVGVWADGTYRHPINLRTAAGAEMIRFYKNNASAVCLSQYSVGGVSKGHIIDVGSSINWFWLALTWSHTADQVISYLNGSSVGTPVTGLGDYSGPITTALISNIDWLGSLGHAAIWDRVLTPTEISILYQ